MRESGLPDCKHCEGWQRIDIWNGETFMGYTREIRCTRRPGTVPPSYCAACREREPREE